ncbi:glycine zipper 2TM domain-containing protein [uncultured Oxalicibacterium sp.]|uniref:glycine zipper 2TM domain-containing protein n=1 Tax=uncultured Oxalicibacterium sp. TaxID=1168540 RepID=UPI0025CCCA43|nr:glycine zipper 2TM domain-containing protein [uncultured Oxalicibacterium sp.]
MEANNNSNRLHPLVAAAAIAVLLVSLVGVAAMTGLLPTSNSSNRDNKEIAAQQAELKAAEEKAAAAEAEAKVAADKAAQLRKEEERRRAAAAKADDRPTQVAQAPICHNCGRVESVRTVQTAGQPSGVGVVGGAVVGGLLGNQIGGGNGKTLATVAGAVGGGYAGNEIEKRTRTHTTYQVRVRMEDGNIRTFPYNNPPQWSEGDRVRVVDGYLRAR